MSFLIEEITSQNYKAAISFVEMHEETSVALMRGLINGYWKSAAFSYYLIYESGDLQEKKIIAVIMNSKAGLLQHCIENPASLFGNEEFIAAIRPIFEKHNLYCIIGDQSSTTLLENAVAKIAPEKEISEQREYLLLLYNPENLPDELLNREFPYETVLCSEKDSDALFPLQKEYDIVEVQPKDRPFSEERSRKNLELMLQSEIIFAIKDGERFVAKAGTNAIGKNFMQLGGVFTLKEYRGKGMAQCLVKSLTKYIVAKGYKTCLFVRVNNTSAKNAYRKVGYTYQSDYQITYYKEN